MFYESPAFVVAGNVTRITQRKGGSAANRVTQYYFAWRDRLVATKAGVEGTESTSLNRPIYDTECDNLGEAIAQEQYDGDNVTISDGNSDGVPDKASRTKCSRRTHTNPKRHSASEGPRHPPTSPRIGLVWLTAIPLRAGPRLPRRSL